MVDGSGSVTVEVLAWLNEQQAPLIKIDWTGNAVTVVSGEGSVPSRRWLELGWRSLRVVQPK